MPGPGMRTFNMRLQRRFKLGSEKHFLEIGIDAFDCVESPRLYAAGKYQLQRVRRVQ